MRRKSGQVIFLWFAGVNLFFGLIWLAHSFSPVVDPPRQVRRELPPPPTLIEEEELELDALFTRMQRTHTRETMHVEMHHYESLVEAGVPFPLCVERFSFLLNGEHPMFPPEPQAEIAALLENNQDPDYRKYGMALRRNLSVDEISRNPYDRGDREVKRGIPPPGLCMFPAAEISSMGRVAAFGGEFTLSSIDCGSPRPFKGLVGQVPTYNTVYVLSQFWGEGYFHFLLENLPRLTLGLRFLKRHPSVKVHVVSSQGFTRDILSLLGIDSDRLVTGDVRAKVAVFPEPISCGSPSLPLVRALRREILGVIPSAPPKEELTIVVKRRGAREVLNHRELVSSLKGPVWEFDAPHFYLNGSRLNLPNPFVGFSRASLLVGPHGAGLANLVAMRPGSHVVEIMTRELNIAYMTSSLMLGLHWTGVQDKEATHHGKIQAPIQRISAAVAKSTSSRKKGSVGSSSTSKAS